VSRRHEVNTGATNIIINAYRQRGLCITLLSLTLFTMAAGTVAAEEKEPSVLAPAFVEADIDWENTAEFPANPDVQGFAKSREELIGNCFFPIRPRYAGGVQYSRKQAGNGEETEGRTSGPAGPDVLPSCCLAIFRADSCFGGGTSEFEHRDTVFLAGRF
jgi:hypothetical protein